MKEENPTDLLIAQAREELDAMPAEGASRLQAFATWRQRQRASVRWVRGIAAVASALWILMFGYSIWFLDLFGRAESFGAVVALVLPPLVLWAASALAGRSGFGAQLLSRSLLIATAMVGGAVSLFQNTTFDSQLGLGIGWGTTRLLVPAALIMGLTLGGHGLTTPQRSLERGGFESILSLSLVMGLADAIVLTFVAVVTLGTVSVGPWPFVLPAVLGIAAYGLFRGRVWGLLLMALANLAEVLLIVDGSLLGGSMVAGAAGVALLITATIQLLLPVPVYAAVIVRRQTWVKRLQAMELSLARILTVVLAVFLAVVALMNSVLLPILQTLSREGLLP